MESYHKERV